MKRLSLAILMLLFAGPAFAAPQCIAPPTCPANQKLAWNGTAFTCADLAPATPSGPGEVTRWDGSKFINTNIAALVNNVFGSGCAAGTVMTWNGGSFVCAPTTPAPPACTGTGQGLQWNGSAFTCVTTAGGAPPPPVCNGTGQSLQWNGTAFTCVTQATLPVPASCAPNQTLKWDGTRFECKDASGGTFQKWLCSPSRSPLSQAQINTFNTDMANCRSGNPKTGRCTCPSGYNPVYLTEFYTGCSGSLYEGRGMVTFSCM